MSKKKFNVLFLIARPAAGKSEVIKYLKSVSLKDRINRFHIGEFEEIDDFPMLWTWFEEDAILVEMGKERLHTDAKGYFKEQYLWNLLIKRICLEYKKHLRDIPDYHKKYTTIIEFARGTEHGGLIEAFNNIDPEILKKAAVMYINVSWKESLRKNRKRFNPAKPDSILEHGLPDDKMEKMYHYTDWEGLSGEDSEYLNINGIKVPYAVFENEDDVTSPQGDPLGQRMEEVLTGLIRKVDS